MIPPCHPGASVSRRGGAHCTPLYCITITHVSANPFRQLSIGSGNTPDSMLLQLFYVCRVCTHRRRSSVLWDGVTHCQYTSLLRERLWLHALHPGSGWGQMTRRQSFGEIYLNLPLGPWTRWRLQRRRLQVGSRVLQRPGPECLEIAFPLLLGLKFSPCQIPLCCVSPGGSAPLDPPLGPPPA